MIKRIINWLLKIFGVKEEVKRPENMYVRKDFMTPCEYRFYKMLKTFEPAYIIVPQINLATIVSKKNKGYINELFKNIDFAIFDKDFKEVLLLIEINDATHQSYVRKDRDLKVKKICNDCNIKLITFYTKYPNEKSYVISRIKKALVYDDAVIKIDS